MLADVREEFTELGRRKGVTTTFTDVSETAAPSVMNAGPLDMDLIMVSLRYAIMWAERDNKHTIRDKLQNLLITGTDSQKIQFIFGSGTYFFPDDVEHLAQLSRSAKALGENLAQLPTRVRFDTVRFVVWRSLGDRERECWEYDRCVAEIFED